MIVNLFCYGSLMYPEVWSLVVKGNYQKQRAKILGYERKKIINEEYPGLIAINQKNIVEGIVYFDISDRDLKKLDIFEGNQYIRVKVNCLLSNDSHLEAYTYIINPQLENILDTTDWNQQQFEKNGLKKFLNRYQGFLLFYKIFNGKSNNIGNG